MALVVEDGTGKADAESYISVADADTYFAARGNATWAAIATSALKEAALRAATDYMEGRYGSLWKGERVDAVQALSWPRADVIVHGFALDADVVPTPVARACAELAVRASADELLADQGSQVTQETVGPISVSYAVGARQGTRYGAVDERLGPYLRGGGSGMVPIQRA